MKKRLWYAGVFVLLLGVECLIALYVRDRFIRPYVGDMLVTVLLYFFVRMIFPRGVRHLSLWIFLFADLKDIACYSAGCLFTAWLERRGV